MTTMLSHFDRRLVEGEGGWKSPILLNSAAMTAAHRTTQHNEGPHRAGFRISGDKT
jgi:hypothetical protein